MRASLTEIAAIIGAEGPGTSPPVEVSGWSIDSRTVGAGELFFAIEGDRFDGHEFVPAAFERDACAAVVARDVAGGEGVLLRVQDTLRALQQIAAHLRQRWGKPIVAVTGSAGKTTTKDTIAQLLGTHLRVGKTEGNFNNGIGLPLSLLRMPANAEAGVIEIGMNRSGEIRSLTGIAAPQVGVVTNVGYAHIESFSSIEGIALAKRELIEELPAGGTAVLNADDERVLRFREVSPGAVRTYGFADGADVRATGYQGTNNGCSFQVDRVQFRSQLTGQYGVSNILAALTVAQLFELPLSSLVEEVAALKPGKMRGERSVWRGITILNDSYNSNPEAARSMVDVLQGEAAARRIAVLGEMLELGRFSEVLHREVGRYVIEKGIDVLIAIGGTSRTSIEGATEAGASAQSAFFFPTSHEAGVFLRDFVQPADAILFKGSRGTHVEAALAEMMR